MDATPGGFDNDRDLVPYVSEDWYEAFVGEMVELGASRDTIGWCLADVNDRCRTQVCSAEVAYGDAAAYARAVRGRQSPVEDPAAAPAVPVMAERGIPAGTVLLAIAVAGLSAMGLAVYFFLGLK